MTSERRFTEDEVRVILDRALRSQDAHGVSQDELVAAASEVGISRAALERAIAHVEGDRGREALRAEILARRRRGFRGHLTTYLAVNALLVGLNVVSALIAWVFVPWALFPAMGWGLGLFFHWRGAYTGEVSERELDRAVVAAEKRAKKAEKERRRLEEEQRREAQRDEKRARRAELEKRAEELGEAVEEGVAELLGAITREIKPDAGSRRKRTRAARVRVSEEADATDALAAEEEADDDAERAAPSSGKKRR